MTLLFFYTWQPSLLAIIISLNVLYCDGSTTNFHITHGVIPKNSLILRQGNQLTNSSVSSSVNTTKARPCSCGGGLCSCCLDLFANAWKQRMCANITYDPDEFSFTTKITMNQRVLYTRVMSGKNPRPICVPVPRLPIVKACVRLYNIYFPGRNVHACISMEGKFSETTLFKVGLDCLRLGANGVALVKPEDGDGLGQVEFLPETDSAEDEDYDDEEDDDDYDY